jgi:hypothetical protein
MRVKNGVAGFVKRNKNIIQCGSQITEIIVMFSDPVPVFFSTKLNNFPKFKIGF